jgi:hypothetical protein
MTKFVRLGLFLLPLILSGCFHRSSAPPLPPQTNAPIIPAQRPAPNPNPPPPPQTTPSPVTTTVEPEPPKPTSKPKHAQSAQNKKSKSSTAKVSNDSPSTNATTANPSATKPAPPQQASAEGAPAGSVIGQLTSGENGNSSQRHQEALQIIENTGQGLMNLKRSLSDQELETATQIRTFLRQAKEALNAEDVDGAMNLANKAKVLLAELIK